MPLDYTITEELRFDPNQPRDKTGKWSGPAGWARGAEMKPDDDTGEMLYTLRTSSVYAGVDDTIHDPWEDAVEAFRPTPADIMSWPREKAAAFTRQRHADLADLHATTEQVRMGEAWATQHELTAPYIEKLAGAEPSLKRPIAVRRDGRVYIIDGHHRVAADWMRDGTSEVIVYDLEALTASAASPRRRAKKVVIASALTGDEIVCYNGSFEIRERSMEPRGEHADDPGPSTPEELAEHAAKMERLLAEYGGAE